jgi:hypothetical protein
MLCGTEQDGMFMKARSKPLVSSAMLFVLAENGKRVDAKSVCNVKDND